MRSALDPKPACDRLRRRRQGRHGIGNGVVELGEACDDGNAVVDGSPAAPPASGALRRRRRSRR